MKPGLWISVGGTLAFLGVALGAFGAHALSSHLGDYEKGIWQTAVFYHLIHAVVIFAIGVGLVSTPSQTPKLETAAWFFSIGVFIFSGSLYGLALTGVKVLGAITPFGGVALLLGWASVVRAGILFHRGD